MRATQGLAPGVWILLSLAANGAPGQEPAATLRLGDVNVDGRVSIADPLGITLWLGLCCGPPPCLRAGDVDQNGTLNLSDAVALYRFLFLGDVAIPGLGEGCWAPLEASREISCEAESSCVEPIAAPPGPFEVFIATEPEAESPPVSGVGLFGKPGEIFEVPFFVYLKDLAKDGDGATAWSLGIQAESGSIEASIVGASTAGTFADSILDGGFKLTSPVDSNRAVSAMSLSFVSPLTIGDGVARSILRATLRVKAPPLGQDGIVFIRAVDGLVGPAQPVALEVVAVRGGPFTPVSTPLKVFVASPIGLGAFIRGDVNGDGALDISDPISTLGVLFLGGSAIDCPDSADSNDDGKVDISDPVTSLGCLFLGGACPSAPYPSCGRDPTSDGLECDSLRFDCE